MGKDTRFAFRTTDSLKTRLAAAAKKVRLSETQLAEAVVEALVDYIEKTGTVTFPVEITTVTAGKIYGVVEPQPSLKVAEDAPKTAPPKKKAG